MPTNAAEEQKPMNFAQKYPLANLTAIILLWLLGLVMAYKCVDAVIFNGVLGQDAHAYWLAAQGDFEYDRRPGEKDAYLYSPAFLTLITPLAMLPWALFLPLWILLEAVLLAWLLKPLHFKWAIPIFLLCSTELVVGNIYILLACASVIGVQKPFAWAFPVLTKVTTGVGLLWFAARGEWRSLLLGIGGTLATVIGLYTLNASQWQAWIEFLLAHREGTPDSQANFFGRCLLAVALVVFGARTQRAWLIAPAMVLASPVLVGFIPLTMLAAIPRLSRLPRQDSANNKRQSPDVAETAGTA